MKRVAIYHRQPTANGPSAKDLLGLTVKCHDDWEIVGYYIDYGRSGRDTARAELNHLLADIRNGKVDIVLAEHYGKIYRDALRMSEFLAECKAHGVEVICTASAA